MSASIAPTVPSPVELRYRHTAQYGVTSAGRLGYRRPGTPVVDEIDDDLLVSPVIESVRRSVGMLDLSGVEDVCVRSSTRNAAALVAIVAADRDTARRVAQALPPDLVAGVSWAEPTPRGRFRGRVVHVSGTDSLEEDFGGVTLPVSATRFSQVNPPAAARLYSDVAALAGEGDLAVELYGGSGAISRHLAPRFRDVLVVETDRTAVRDGRRAAREAGVDNLRFQEADAARVRGVDRADVVIVDPPRAGMSSRALAKVLAWRARRLVYVSCDPATWARDAARTVAAGYDLVSVQPHDFFPYTHHVEILSYFELRG
jgi:tRNA/tmRNA/rRNA uracil-C5-methylase (TrmA/RlmC/RlmD family)